MKRFLIGIAVAAATATGAYAAPATQMIDTSIGKVLADDKGMVLYTYDRDASGAAASACTGGCIANWPPFLAAAGATADGDWTIVDVVDKDGAMKKMWAYKGLPVYYWVMDAKAGDTTGDGRGGVWHVVK